MSIKAILNLLARKSELFYILCIIFCCKFDHSNAESENHIGEASPSVRIGQFTSKINKYLYPSHEISVRETLVWSPLSVYSTLLTLSGGAGGQTLKELRELLEIPLNEMDNSELSPILNKSSKSLSYFSLKMATGLFIDDNFKLKEGFLNKLRLDQEENGFYGSVDVISQSMDPARTSPEKLAFSVNQWINSTTDGLINNIVQPQNFNKNTKMVVVNGIQFKGKWKTQFNGADTEKRVFYGLRGPSKVKMMFQRSTQDFGKFMTEDENKFGFQVLKLSYKENGMRLVFILPDNSTQLLSIVKYLKSIQINEIMAKLEPTELDIYIPKLRVESVVPIKATLEKAGLETLFSPLLANLTRMLDMKNDGGNSAKVALHVDELVHKTLMIVDEEGTKAAAATAGLLIPLSSLAHQSLDNFTLNKPFLFFLKDEHSSTVFQGVINDLFDTDDYNNNNAIPKPIPVDEKLIKTNQSKNVEIVGQINPLEEKQKDGEDDGEWWIHKGIPEYLVDDNKSSTAIPPQIPNEKVAELPRFQQPEPTHPEGIRFPFPGSKNWTKIRTGKRNKTGSHRRIALNTFHGERINNNIFIVDE